MTDNSLIQNKAGDDVSLESRLKAVEVPVEVKAKIAQNHGVKVIRETILTVLNLGVVENFLNLAESIEAETNEYKKAILLQQLLDGQEKNEKVINRIENFIKDPTGNVLFNKTIHILNSNPINHYYSDLLSNALKFIFDSDFQSAFSQHNYALSQIERLSPQALILLADYKQWPGYKKGNYSSEHGVVTSVWVEEFLPFYMRVKGITDETLSRRIAHAFRELIQNELVQSKIHGQTDSRDMSSVKDAPQVPAYIETTELGDEILQYINPRS